MIDFLIIIFLGHAAFTFLLVMCLIGWVMNLFKGKNDKKLDKYSYVGGTRYMDNGSRNYEVAGYRLPSVTTILGRTKDDTYLKKWIADKGKKEAERIKNASAVRGTSMHKYLENYVLGKGYEDLTELGQETKRMAQKVIEVGLAPVSGYFGSEVTVYYPGLYAGSTDLVGVHNDKETIIDFKQANRPRKKNGLATINCRLEHMPWRMTMCTVQT